MGGKDARCGQGLDSAVRGGQGVAGQGPAGAAPQGQVGALDLTSALYLDMRHPATSLEPWAMLTLGKPAALEQPPGAATLARGLASLLGCEAALLLPSTLHLYWDLFAMLAQETVTVLIDGGAYPIARWGAQQAMVRGSPVQVFRHGDAACLARLARRWRAAGRRPVVLADGYSPGHERPPPLSAYAEVAAREGGWLVLDDTQSLGLLGHHGGGSVQLHGLARGGAPVLVGASLAKAFGAPLAVLAGSPAMLERFDARSLTRMHSSPPSVAAIAAGRRALRVNAACGDALRGVLRLRVLQFRAGLATAGITCRGGTFPVQVVPLAAGADGVALQSALKADGVLALLQGHRGAEALTFLLRAGHSARDVARAVAALEHHMKELA